MFTVGFTINAFYLQSLYSLNTIIGQWAYTKRKHTLQFLCYYCLQLFLKSNSKREISLTFLFTSHGLPYNYHSVLSQLREIPHNQSYPMREEMATSWCWFSALHCVAVTTLYQNSGNNVDLLMQGLEWRLRMEILSYMIILIITDAVNVDFPHWVDVTTLYRITRLTF